MAVREFLATVLSLLAGVGAAAVIWLWWRGPVPTFIVFTAALHGMLLGVSLRWIVQRLEVRSQTTRWAIGVTAGILSVGALTTGQYIDDAYAYRAQQQRAVAGLARLPAAPRWVVANYDRNVLLPATGRTGVAGYLVLGNRGGRSNVTVRTVEALLVIGISAALGVVTRSARDPAVD